MGIGYSFNTCMEWIILTKGITEFCMGHFIQLMNILCSDEGFLIFTEIQVVDYALDVQSFEYQ